MKSTIRTRRITAAQTRQILVDRYPQTFKPRFQKKIPLKIGIMEDLRKSCPDLSHNQLQLALKDYTNGRSYLEALQFKAKRRDLRGRSDGEVTQLQAEIAKQQLELLNSKIKDMHTLTQNSQVA